MNIHNFFINLKKCGKFHKKYQNPHIQKFSNIILDWLFFGKYLRNVFLQKKTVNFCKKSASDM